MTRKAKPMPSQEYLNECFEYDCATGYLYWKERPIEHFMSDAGMNIQNAQCCGRRALCCIHRPSGRFYGKLTVDGVKYLFYTARVVFKMFHGYDPTYVDHINRNVTDNRIENLRDADINENARNTSRRKNRKYDLPKGIYKSKTKKDGTQSYQATITCDGKFYNVGTFSSIEEAVLEREKLGKLLHGEFWCNGFVS